MKYNDSLRAATGILYKAVWQPSDWPANQPRACSTYVVAKSIDEATARVTDNPFDIKQVIVLGHVIEQERSAVSLAA